MGNRTRVTHKHRTIESGKAGEHLVCADLLLSGHNPILVSDPASPFDILLRIDSRLLKIQVKSTSKPRFNWGSVKGERKFCTTPSYLFNVSASGYKRQSYYSTHEVDIFAFVSLDTKTIAYLPYELKRGSICFRIPKHRGEYYDEMWDKYNPIVMQMYKDGLTTPEISQKLGMEVHSIYDFRRRKKEFKIKKKQSRYFDEFPIEKCLSVVLMQKLKDA